MNKILESMEPNGTESPEAEDIGTDAMDEITKMVETVEGFFPGYSYALRPSRPFWLGDLPLKATLGLLNHGDLPLKATLGLLNHGDLPLKATLGLLNHGDLPLKATLGLLNHGDLPRKATLGLLNHGDLPRKATLRGC